MAERIATRIVRAQPLREGAGVRVYRTIGTSALRNLDPFLMLDYFDSDDPGDYTTGFPEHPHRGFITFTYVLDGAIRHRDSMGNEGVLSPGAAQWMKAASGVLHSEMPEKSSGLLRGFQLWINLPATEKMTSPVYREYQASAFPVVSEQAAKVKILIGSYRGLSSPIQDPLTDVHYYDITIAAGGRWTAPCPRELTAFGFIFEGEVSVGSTTRAPRYLAVLEGGDTLAFAAPGSRDTRMIVAFGKPLREPVAQYGPFVMNTREELEQAIVDYRSGRLVRHRALVNP